MQVGDRVVADSGATYEILDRLVDDYSGEAEVFRIRSLDEEKKPIRVLKEYKENMFKEAKFNHELDVLSYLNGAENRRIFPGVVNVLDSSRSHLCIILEYFEGRDLEKATTNRSNGSFSLPEALALTTHISKILSYMFYRSGVVHRDLKPRNILLDHKASSTIRNKNSSNLEEVLKPGAIKFCDFTLSFKKGQSRVHEITPSNRFLGTPRYMPPEIMKAKSRGASSSDVWSLSIMLYDMLSEEGAYPGLKSVQGILEFNISKQDPPKIYRDLFGFEEFIYEMRSYDPEKRPNTGEVFDVTSKFYDQVKNRELVLSS